jgi:hypothetical protein
VDNFVKKYHGTGCEAASLRHWNRLITRQARKNVMKSKMYDGVTWFAKAAADLSDDASELWSSALQHEPPSRVLTDVHP